jgi:hypothetical protein
MVRGNFGLIQVGQAPFGYLHTLRNGLRRGFVAFRGSCFRNCRWLSRRQLKTQCPDFRHEIAILGFQPIQTFDHCFQFRRLLGT